jgi:hypothetical protein
MPVKRAMREEMTSATANFLKSCRVSYSGCIGVGVGVGDDLGMKKRSSHQLVWNSDTSDPNNIRVILAMHLLIGLEAEIHSIGNPRIFGGLRLLHIERAGRTWIRCTARGIGFGEPEIC